MILPILIYQILIAPLFRKGLKRGLVQIVCTVAILAFAFEWAVGSVATWVLDAPKAQATHAAGRPGDGIPPEIWDAIHANGGK